MKVTGFKEYQAVEAVIDDVFEVGKRVKRIVWKDKEVWTTVDSLLAYTRTWGDGTKSDHVVAPFHKVVKSSLTRQERQDLLELYRNYREERKKNK